jgi:hypothetical protein
MTKGKSAKSGDPTKTLDIEVKPGKSEARALAEVGINPAANAMATTHAFAKGSFGDLSYSDLFAALNDDVAKARDGDISAQRAMLAAQSYALNSIFTEMARRAALNMSEYVKATESYMRLALKAQAQSRATIEALDRLANGREQTVRHVHVDNRGGQAVIADTVQTGGRGNENFDGQPHALESMGHGPGQPLWSANAEREAVPVASNA